MSNGQVLSPDAIAALVEAAKEGRLPDESSADRGRQRRMRTVDFTRPTKFTADQERRMKRALETFCRTASTRLSAELRMPLELEVINVSQLTWGNAHAQVPSRSVSCLIDVPDVPTRMLLSAEMNLVMSAIELLLGGTPGDGSTQRERRLTDIDWALARHFVERLIAQLSIVWHDITDVQLGVAGLDMHLETAQTAPVSEPTLALTMEARMDRDSATLALLLPYSAIAPVAHRFSSRDDVSLSDDERQSSAVREAVGRVEMTVRAEVAAVDMPIEQVLALQPGDVLRLDARADDGVTLFAGAVPMHRAMPGRSGGRRAVQVTERLGGTP
jgi:flagellar motor switch protein FliM